MMVMGKRNDYQEVLIISPGDLPVSQGHTFFKKRHFLGIPLTESTPDHSTLSHLRQRFPQAVHEQAMAIILNIARQKKLLQGNPSGGGQNVDRRQFVDGNDPEQIDERDVSVVSENWQRSKDW